MNFKRIYFNANPDGGGGADPNAPQLPSDEETKLFQSLYEKGEDALTEEEKKQFQTLKGKFDLEEIGEDGKPLTPEQKKAIQEVETKVKTILAKPEKERTVDEINFLKENTEIEEPDLYSQVDEITGYPVKLDYGDVDPKSPEGIAKREVFIRETAQKEYDELLRERYPRAYAFMNHIATGGKEEDFFKPENKDYLSVSLTKTDTVAQESFYRQALALRGNKPEQIEALVRYAKDSGKLFEESKSELEALQARQKLEEERKTEASEREQREYSEAVTSFYNLLQQQIEKGINGSVIPIPERRNFLKFVADNTIYDNENKRFTIIRSVDPKNIEKEMALEWFKYKGGDLKAMVEAKAKTENAIKIKKRYSAKITPRSAGATTKRIVSLGEL
jgi:hypothetical protein